MHTKQIKHTINFPDKEIINHALGISADVPTQADEMAHELTGVTFFPREGAHVTPRMRDFSQRLEASMKDLGVRVVPFDAVHFNLPFTKIIKRFFRVGAMLSVGAYSKLSGRQTDQVNFDVDAIKKSVRRSRVATGTVIVSLGEQNEKELPIDWLSSYKKSSVVTITELPEHITRDSDFETHFDTAMNMFAHHMSHLVIGLGSDFFVVYNFNASHPTYDLNGGLHDALLSNIIPKLVAPISPVHMKEFTILKERFNHEDQKHKQHVEDMVEGGKLLSGTGLWPKGKKVAELPWRSKLYKWIGSIHMDQRNGMSYGFLARQLPVKLPKVMQLSDAEERYKFIAQKDQWVYRIKEGFLFRVRIDDVDQGVLLPDVWVLTQRSGCDKVNMDPANDLIKLGISGGQMQLQLPSALVLDKGVRSSFDTQVILAHALGNVIVASVEKHLNPSSPYVKMIEKDGAAISHWHGYINKHSVPEGWHVYGTSNPHVACSSPQSAIYALQGKLKAYAAARLNSEDYLGDVHIEPHHGSNIIYPSLKELSTFFASGSEVVSLGNKYL